MCGVAALLSNDAKPVSQEALQSAMKSLHHRGPDGANDWISPSKRVGLGHVRLSIIDLAGGTQPLHSEDGMIHAVVNGEFYDFQRIRRELEAKGHRFATQTDSEILIHLYEEKGANCVHDLRGEYAFILWDEREQLFFAGRDRCGIKPLYYAEHEGTLHMASEAKALFASGVPSRWAPDAIFKFTQISTFAQDRSPFAGVHQVPPGHYMLATKHGRRLIPYWDFKYSQEKISDEDAVEQFREVLNEAVRLRLHADVPVGCYLSGGLDSCSVLGIAAKYAKHPIRTFTLSFDHESYDEAAIAEEMAKRAGAEFQPIAIRQEQLADHFADGVWHTEVPFINPHGVAKFLLSRAVRAAGYKVVITGEGSDEILAGYPSFRRDAILYGGAAADEQAKKAMLEELQDANQVSGGLLLPSGEMQSGESLRRALGFFPSWLEAFSGMHTKMLGVFSDEMIEAGRGQDIYRDILNGINLRTQMQGQPPVNQAMLLWSKTFLPNYILTVLGDRMEMAHSIEGRLPFLDHAVVEAACRLPMNFKIRGMTEKFILREAARPVLTDTVYRRQKHPFLSPPAALNPSGALYRLLQDSVRSANFAALPFFDAKKVIALLNSAGKMELPEMSALDGVFTSILSLYFMQERFGL